MTNLGTVPGGNDGGQVVGHSLTDTGSHAFIWDELAGMSDLNDLIDPSSGWTLTGALAINNSGQIVANGDNGTLERAFLLTPIASIASVPLPAGLQLLLAGLGALRVRQRAA